MRDSFLDLIQVWSASLLSVKNAFVVLGNAAFGTAERFASKDAPFRFC